MKSNSAVAVKTRVSGGGVKVNHSEAVVVKSQHQCRRESFQPQRVSRVKTRVSGGGTHVNHNEAVAVKTA
jgi:urease gamma subunit